VLLFLSLLYRKSGSRFHEIDSVKHCPLVWFQVTFKNKASRPYSFHLQGVYDRSQGGGVAQTQTSSSPPGVPGEAVPPGESRVYNWRITKKQGPTNTEFDCKAGAYYSTVNKVGVYTLDHITETCRSVVVAYCHVDPWGLLVRSCTRNQRSRQSVPESEA